MYHSHNTGMSFKKVRSLFILFVSVVFFRFCDAASPASCMHCTTDSTEEYCQASQVIDTTDTKFCCQLFQTGSGMALRMALEPKTLEAILDDFNETHDLHSGCCINAGTAWKICCCSEDNCNKYSFQYMSDIIECKTKGMKEEAFTIQQEAEDAYQAAMQNN